MSLMPCFDSDQADAEGRIVGRLLAGYGELELQMCMCLIVAEANIDTPIRDIFSVRGAEKRIEIGENALKTNFSKAGLTTELMQALSDLDWCRQIRNQYSHCHWYWTAKEGLCFVNLEELAKQPSTITSVTEDRHRIDLALPQKQEEYFWYVKQCFMHLETAYRTWDQAQTRGGRVRPASLAYPKPLKIPQPPAHN